MKTNDPSYKVSLFGNFREVHPMGTVDISSWLFSEKYRPQVDEIRRTQDSEQRRRLKASLPCITPSGIFRQRSASQLIQHSGLLCIDIDGADNLQVSDWETLKLEMASFPGLFYAGLSASGNGLFLLIRIANPQRHTSYFHAIASDLKAQGITVDKRCRDLARLRGASYDPHPIYCPSPTAYNKIIYEFDSRRSRNIPATSERKDITTHRVECLLSLIEQTGTNIADDYDTWLRIGCSLAAEYGESGRGYFHTVSRQSDKYHPEQCDRQYNHCLGCCSKSSIGTFFYTCKLFCLTLTF